MYQYQRNVNRKSNVSENSEKKRKKRFKPLTVGNHVISIKEGIRGRERGRPQSRFADNPDYNRVSSDCGTNNIKKSE